jgi:hypothetical protein
MRPPRALIYSRSATTGYHPLPRPPAVLLLVACRLSLLTHPCLSHDLILRYDHRFVGHSALVDGRKAMADTLWADSTWFHTTASVVRRNRPDTNGMKLSHPCLETMALRGQEPRFGGPATRYLHATRADTVLFPDKMRLCSRWRKDGNRTRWL